MNMREPHVIVKPCNILLLKHSCHLSAMTTCDPSVAPFLKLSRLHVKRMAPEAFPTYSINLACVIFHFNETYD